MSGLGIFDYDKVNMRNFGGHHDEVNCATLSADFEILVTGSDDNRLRIFNTVTDELVTTLDGHQGAIKAVAISPNSCFIASASYDKTVRIWITRKAQCLHVLTGHVKSVECLAFSPDSALLCSGSWDKTVIMWNVENGIHRKVLHGHRDLVQSVAFSHDGTLLATGSWDYSVRLWAVALRPTQLPVLDGSGDHQSKHSDNDGLLRTLTGHRGNIHTVAFSMNGSLASGSWDKTVRLWDTSSGHCLFVLEGHGGWVQALAFSDDSLHLVSAGDHDAVLVWSCTSGELCQTLDLAETESVSHCAFGPNGIIVTSASGTLKTASRENPDNRERDDGLVDES